LSIKADEMADNLQGIYDQVKKAIKDSNATYKAHSHNHRCNVTFEVGDLVLVVLTRDHFPATKYNKLRERKIGLCEILQKINDNAYQFRLPSHLKTFDVFNVNHLIPCFS
jgi:mRNA-degrading endonuclease RelE of RelBE toxin-antitoxin system